MTDDDLTKKLTELGANSRRAGQGCNSEICLRQLEPKCEAVGAEWCWKHDRHGASCQPDGAVDAPPPSVGQRVDLGRVREILVFIRDRKKDLPSLSDPTGTNDLIGACKRMAGEAIDILDAAGKEI